MKNIKDDHHSLNLSPKNKIEWLPGPEEKSGDDEIVIPILPLEITIEVDLIPNQELFDLLKVEVNQNTIPYDGPPITILSVESKIQPGQLMRLAHEENEQPFNLMFSSPIELLPGDLILLDTRTGNLLAVKRGEEIIYNAAG